MALKLKMLRSVTPCTMPLIGKPKFSLRISLFWSFYQYFSQKKKQQTNPFDNYVWSLFGMPQCNKFEENGISKFSTFSHCHGSTALFTFKYSIYVTELLEGVLIFRSVSNK